MFCSLKGKIATLVITGLTLATVGFVLYLTFPLILEDQIKKKLVIKEGSESYKNWKEVPVPIYIHFYFFNVTNPQEVYDLKKPELEELGPYTFREEREKVNITWNENGTVSYRQIKRWYFQPDKTVGSLNDRVVTLNVPMVAAVTKVQQMDQPMMYYAMQIILDDTNETWLIDKSVDELLFKGYNDTLLDLAKDFMNLPYDRFGWFYARNNTDDGEFVVFTGDHDNIESLDVVYTWNDLKSVTAFDPPCNLINGSAGDMWPPNLTHKDKPTIFITDICRSLSFSFLQEVSISDLKAYRYWADNTELDNGKYNPDNKCFCSDDICLPAGAVNVSACKFDAPAVVSYPHFLFADPIYSQGVIGMKPNPQEHRMYLDLIPEMGIPLSVAARMQINVVFDKIDGIKQFENITRRTYFPVIWFSETAVAGPDIISQLKLPLITLPLIAKIFSFVFIGIGSFLVFAAFGLAILFALGKIEDSPRSLSISPLVEDKSERLKQEREPAYAAVKSGGSS